MCIRPTTQKSTDPPEQQRQLDAAPSWPKEGHNAPYGGFLPKESNPHLKKLLQLNVRVWEMRETEDHASGHPVDTISKIQPVNNFIWQSTQFPPQTITKRVGKKKRETEPTD